MEPTLVVMLPGTGSDARFVEDSFTDAVTSRGWTLRAVDPDPRNVVAGYRDALDAAAHERRGPLVVGGVSLGAAVAVQWALDHPDLVTGVVAAMPAWSGPADGSLAAVSASTTARALRERGLEVTLAEMAASAPAWLSRTLTRSWRAQWPELPVAMDDAAAYVAPTAATLGTLAVPVGVVAAVDDPIHPLHVAEHWYGAFPRARLETFALALLASEPGELGRRGLRALDRAVERT